MPTMIFYLKNDHSIKGDVMDIYKKDNWINPNILYTFNRTIIEYDMREAGYSLVKEYNLLPKKEMNSLRVMNKDARHVKIGKLQRDLEGFSKDLMNAFADARKGFFEMNHLEESDIISIKKDAIFVTKKCIHEIIGNHVNFRPKNTYTSYIHLDKMLEIYYHPDKTDIKGIGKDNIYKHQDYMVSFINTFCDKMEQENPRNVLTFLRRFADYYKNRDLDVGYYRTFNNRSEFVMAGEEEVMYDQVDATDIWNLDISYNFFNVIVKLFKIPI